MYVLFLLAMSLVSFILYGLDKFFARRRARRIAEKVLLSFGFFGGSVGALLSMQLFRHKTKHYYFYAVNVAGLILHAGIAAFLLLNT